MLMDELNKEIDHSAVFGVTDPQRILCHQLKALMLNVLTESYQNLRLSEHLRSAVPQTVEEAENEDLVVEQNSLVSAYHALQHAELNTMRKHLAELEQHLVSAEEEKVKMCTELQTKLCAYEYTVESLRLELSSAQCCIQSLKDHLHQSEDSVQSLKLKLKEKQEKIHLLNEKQFSAHESTTSVQMDLNVSKKLSYSLQQQLSATEARNHALQETLMACKTRDHEAEREKQQEVESKEECKSKIRMICSFKGLNNWLELDMGDLQEQLRIALEKEGSLRRTVEEATAKPKAEVERFQQFK